MTQSEIYMDNDDLRLCIDVQPVFIDELENSKNTAIECASSAQQSAQSAASSLTNITNFKTNLELFYADSVYNLTNLLNQATEAVNSAKNTAVTSIQTLKNTVLNNINSTLENAIGTIQISGQSIINQAKNYAEQAQNTVDNRVSLDHLNQSKSLETGSISTDPDVLSWIETMSHSTFDISKFGVVVNGSTVSNPAIPFNQNGLAITTDGIACGFNSSSYLAASISNWTETSLWEIHINFKLGATIATQGILHLGNYNYIVCSTSGEALNFSFNGKSFSAGTPVANDEYDCYWGWNGSQMYLKYSVNGVPQTDKTVNMTSSVGRSDLTLGYYGGDGRYFSGSIDLKQFSLTIDGVPVFNGNKTGIDTIKPVNFTVYTNSESSPFVNPSLPFSNNGLVITKDGTVSGFSSSSYITTGITLAGLGTNFDIYGAFKTGGDVNTSQAIYSMAPIGGLALIIADGKLRSRYYTDDTNYIQTVGVTNLTNNSYYLYHTSFGYDGTKYVSKTYISSDNGTAWTLETTQENATIPYDNSSIVRLGLLGTDSPFLGLTDLNDFRIYADQVLVYQPCLKIPYTESKTKDKIVSAAYRRRVQYVYLQEGFALYHTLDENNNFTLPMGNLYGMIINLYKQIENISQE